MYNLKLVSDMVFAEIQEETRRNTMAGLCGQVRTEVSNNGMDAML